jgi:hypothetical protein
MERALSGDGIRNPDGSGSSVRTVDFGAEGGFYVAPTIRKVGGKFVILTPEDAVERAMANGDAFGPFETNEAALSFSKEFSGALRPIGRAADILKSEGR